MIGRIKSLLAVKNLSSSQFANEIGVQRSGISHILSGRNKPSLDFVLKILDHYPDININWLLKGEGEMFQTIQSDSLFSEEAINEKSIVKDEAISEYKKMENNSEKTEIKVKEEKKISQDNQQDEKAKPENIADDFLPELVSNRIVKIIIVYDDNTFETLLPKK